MSARGRAVVAAPIWDLLDGAIMQADCLEALRVLPACSVDAIVTDPPYGIGFMGHDWDQPGEFGPVRSNGTPALFAGGRAAGGHHGSGPRAALERQMARSARRATQRDPESGAGHGYEREAHSRRNTQGPCGKREGAKPLSGHGPREGVRFGGATGRRHTGGDGDSVAGGAMQAGRYDLSPTANRRFQAWCEAWATEALRVLKPGGHMLVFGGTRTYHRMASGIEDAGFEIRDCLVWLFGSGFPKSLNVGMAIDAAAGAEREVLAEGKAVKRMIPGAEQNRSGSWIKDDGRAFVPAATVPATPEAAQWEGWGTALKPGHEPIVVARKPLTGTVVQNVLAHGTGAINIDGCREPTETTTDAGRWPANVLLDTEAAAMLDEQSGELVSGANPTSRGSDKHRDVYGDFAGQRSCVPARGVDVGGASRFFYCAKASSAERNAGLQDMRASEQKRTTTATSTIHNGRAGSMRVDEREYVPTARANVHPTVKPVEVMRWLVRLVTPAGGVLLDMFAGSGTTGCAAALEGVAFVGVERESEYVAIAEARIAWWAAQPAGRGVDVLLERDQVRARIAASGQASMFDAPGS